MKPAIRAENLSKRFHIGARQHGGYLTLRETMTRGMIAPWRGVRHLWGRRARAHAGQQENAAPDTIWALKDVSFEVPPGEVLGIIGRNGAGKSTLLKVLSRITEPTNGRVRVRGRVGSLLEVGTGFHPELTGRENIYLNGAILGMSRREMQSCFDQIVQFAEIEDFIDTPVKRYSSGMYVRLAFAVAAHLQSEILLIDEVLAVGDQAFQRKCLGKIDQIGHSGRTVLFVSHDMGAIEYLCPKSILLEDGRVPRIGITSEVISEYQQRILQRSGTLTGETTCLEAHKGRKPGSARLLTRLRIANAEQRPCTRIPTGGACSFEVAYRSPELYPGLWIAVFVCDHMHRRITMLHTRINSRLRLDEYGCGVVQCNLPVLPLVPGDYTLDLAAGSAHQVLDYIECAARVHVIPSDYFGTGELPHSRHGSLALEADWQYFPSRS